MRVLIIDNYDSFTFNLVQYLGVLGAQPVVRRNDGITVAGIEALRPDALVISPGPRTPREAGVSVPAVQALGARLPILGVCLGHQSVAAAYGGTVVRGAAPVHGKVSHVHHRGHPLFNGLATPFAATRYHSLVVQRPGLPACLDIIAETAEGQIMGLAHREHPVWGVQFHPESICTEGGMEILANFLHLAGGVSGAAA